VYSRGNTFSKREANRSTMQDDDGKPEHSTDAFARNTGKDAGRDRRQDRLKLALRENLKRRKSQARGRADLASATSNSQNVSPHDDGAAKADKQSS